MLAAPLVFILPCRVVISAMIASKGNTSFPLRAAFGFLAHIVFDLFLLGPTILFSKEEPAGSMVLCGDCGALCILAAIGAATRAFFPLRLVFSEGATAEQDTRFGKWSINDLVEITFWVATAMAFLRTLPYAIGLTVFFAAIVFYTLVVRVVFYGLGPETPESLFKIGSIAMSLGLVSLYGGCFFGPIALAFFPFSFVATFVGVIAFARTMGLRVVNETGAPTRPTTEKSLGAQAK